MSERALAREFVSKFLRDLKAGCDIGAESIAGEHYYAPECEEEISQWEEVLRHLGPEDTEFLERIVANLEELAPYVEDMPFPAVEFIVDMHNAVAEERQARV